MKEKLIIILFSMTAPLMASGDKQADKCRDAKEAHKEAGERMENARGVVDRLKKARELDDAGHKRLKECHEKRKSRRPNF